MKIGYVVAILAIILLVGCAQTTPTPPVTPVETPPVEPVVETPPVTTTTIAETPKGEIEILVKGFDPTELTVKKGTTVKWVNTAPAVRILGGNVRSPNLKSGDTFEYTFDKAGEYTIIEVLSKARGKVIVTE